MGPPDGEPDGPPTAPTAGARPGARWHVLSASARGALHRRRDLPNQDAVNPPPGHFGPQPRAVAAVADGHGSSRHFRSGTGSALAVQVAHEAAEGFASRHRHARSPAEVEAAARAELVPEILASWRAGVADHLVAHPFHEEEEALRSPDDEAVIAYGSTLLLAVMDDRWLATVQIGDGDMILVDASGEVSRPVPGDPELDGLRTTSLCQTDAESSFRVGVVGPTGGLALALLASDGFGNAQAEDEWEGPVGRDIARLVAAEGVDRVASRLVDWVRRCASPEGSGDDTTVALVADPVTVLVKGWEPELERVDDTRPLSQPAGRDRPREGRRMAAARAPAAGEGAATGTHTSADGRPTGPRASPEATTAARGPSFQVGGRNWWPWAALGALVAAAAVTTVVLLSGSSQPSAPPPATTTAPTATTVIGSTPGPADTNLGGQDNTAGHTGGG